MSIEFKLTRDPRLLEQYYALREQCFREELGLPDFDGSEDAHDRQGHIVLAIQDGRCIGGVRISPNVSLQSQIQQLGLKRETCCMWERFVFDPAVRTVQLIRDFFIHLVEVTREVGFHHAMVLSSRLNARFYRQCGSAIGYKFQIHRHVPHSATGAFSGLEHYLSVGHLQKAQPLRMAG
jgi:hypothetical protein